MGFAASGIGYLAGVLLPPASASTVQMVACLLCAVFSGIEPPLQEVRQYPVVNWAWYLSFGTHVAQAVYITFTQYWEGIRDRQAGADKFGFDIRGFGTAIGAMFGIGLMFRAFALLALRWATTGEALPGLRPVQQLLRPGASHSKAADSAARTETV